MDNDPLQTAIDLIHSGQKQRAQKVLQLILNEDIHNISAWFWYVETCATAEERLPILYTCARFNPDNAQVKTVLDALRKRQTRSDPTLRSASEPVENESKAAVNLVSGGISQVGQKLAIVERAHEETPKVQQPNKKAMKPTALIMWSIAGMLMVAFAILVVYEINSTPADPTSHRFTQPIEYYLYVPKAYEPSHAWPLFIGIHGSGGTGLDCWNLWQPYAEREGFILLCPTMPDEGGGWLQTDGETYTWAAISQVTSQYNIRPRYFLVGFSAGAAFVQGFCLHYPRSVEAVAVLSAGIYRIPFPLMGGGTPFLIVIGDRDDPNAINGSKQFAQALTNNGITVTYWLLPGVGHQVTDRTKQLTIDFYRAVNK